MNKSVSIVIVTWNNAADIEECLTSIKEQEYKNLNVVLVDNASSDKTVDIAKKTMDEIEVIKLSKNVFLSPANNIGIKYSIEKHNPEYIMVLNPDTVLDKNLVSTLVESLEQDSNAFAIGPKVKFYKNKFEGLINSSGLIFDGFKQAYDRGFEEEDRGQFDRIEYVFGVTGACILYRTARLKELGFYWEKIKLYMDELELFIRASKISTKGFKVLYNPNTTLHHKYMKSSDQSKIERINKLRNQAWLWIALRHYPLKSKLAMIKDYLINK